MKIGLMNRDAILAKYPESKPVCLNYVEMRSELLALCLENERLQKRLTAFEEGLNPDAADKFCEVADSLLEKMDVIISYLANKTEL